VVAGIVVSGTVVSGTVLVVSGAVVVVGIGPPGVQANKMADKIAKKLTTITDRLISAP
jgi:hypothetical protein